MPITWPQADYPRTSGGAADLFGAEPLADGDLFAVAVPMDPVGAAAGAVAPLRIAGGCAASFSALDVSWFGAPAYTPPVGGVNVSWYLGPGVPDAVEGVAAAVLGAFTIGGQAQGSAGVTTAVAAASIAAVALAGGAIVVVGAAGAAGAQVLALAIGGAVVARLVVQGAAAGAVPFIAGITPAITAQHPRYELRGQVRLAGNPVERRVRAYARSTGALLGQGDTTGGFFRIPAGFAEIECTVLPIDLATDATDYEPPTANRVLCVLAEDDA